MKKLAFALAFMAVLGLVGTSVYAETTEAPKCEKGFHYSKKLEKCVRNANAAIPAVPAPKS
jgi:hypothetical protein